VSGQVWLLIEVEDSILKDRPLGNGVKWRYLVSPTLRLTREAREADEVVRSASDAGFEVTYASDVHWPVPPWVREKIELRVMAELREKLGKNVRSFAVSIRPLSRLVKYPAQAE
jgi:hypothetical protein